MITTTISNMCLQDGPSSLKADTSIFPFCYVPAYTGCRARQIRVRRWCFRVSGFKHLLRRSSSFISCASVHTRGQPYFRIRAILSSFEQCGRFWIASVVTEQGTAHPESIFNLLPYQSWYLYVTQTTSRLGTYTIDSRSTNILK